MCSITHSLPLIHTFCTTLTNTDSPHTLRGPANIFNPGQPEHLESDWLIGMREDDGCKGGGGGLLVLYGNYYGVLYFHSNVHNHHLRYK